MPEIDAGGVRLHFEAEGSGAPVLLLHGMGGSYATGWAATGWTTLLTGAGYRAIGLDARGCRHSSPIDEPELLRERPYIADVTRLLDALDVERAHVVGYSMGAGHALGLALAAPGRLRSITLGGLGGIALAMAGLFMESAAHSRERLVRSAALIGDRAAQRGASAPHYTAACFEALARDPLAAGALEQIALPALIVVGDGDTAQGDFAALAVTAMLERRIRRARRLVLNGVNHLTCVSDPRFKQAVLDFLAGQED